MYHEDLLTLENVLHSGVVDAIGLCNDRLLWTTWRMIGMALSGVLLWRGALSSEVARAITVKEGVVGGDSNGRWRRQA
jgi:hypothetical protein